MNKLLGLSIMLLIFTAQAAHEMNIMVEKESQANGTGDQYRLSCQGATGTVKYTVEGLPEGVYLNGNMLTLSQEAVDGNYILRVKAVDESQNVAEKIISLSISSANEQSNSASFSSSSSSSSSSGDSQRLNNILSVYSTVTEISSTITYEGNRYPEADLPTGGDSNSVNTNLINIQNAQAQATAKDKNEITAENVALRASSERHQNAIKAITNLLTIIDQARANRNKAYSDITFYSNSYKEAQGVQRRAQDTIIAINTKVQQIISAINGLNKKIEDVSAAIADWKEKRASLVSELKDAEKKLNEEIANKNKIQAEIDAINAKIQAERELLNAHMADCERIKAEIVKVQVEVKALDEKIKDLMARIQAAENDLRNKELAVADLERKLQAARASRDQAAGLLRDLNSEKVSATAKFNQYNQKLADLQAELARCQAEVDRLMKIIADLENNAYGALLKEVMDKIEKYQSEVNNLNDQIAQIDQTLPDLEASLKTHQEDLVYLKSQLTIVQEQLRKAYVDGNDANTMVMHAKQNFDAASERYQKESQIITQSTMNLEKARAEEALARLALEETIAYYTDALPYAIVPNGNGQTNAGTPYGNNPSGSPLGPISNNGNGAAGSFQVNWTHYLSQAYGSGVNPAFAGSVTTLYPFNFGSSVSGNTVSNLRGVSQQGCNQEGPMKSATGTIKSVGASQVVIEQQNGEEMTVEVTPCTQMNSNKQNYKMKAGNKAVVKGRMGKKNRMSGQAMTCLAE